MKVRIRTLSVQSHMNSRMFTWNILPDARRMRKQVKEGPTPWHASGGSRKKSMNQKEAALPKTAGNREVDSHREIIGLQSGNRTNKSAHPLAALLAGKMGVSLIDWRNF